MYVPKTSALQLLTCSIALVVLLIVPAQTQLTEIPVTASDSAQPNSDANYSSEALAFVVPAPGPSAGNDTDSDSAAANSTDVAPFSVPSSAPAPAPSRRRFRKYRKEQVLGRISNFTQPKLGPYDVDKLLAEQDALYLGKLGSYLQAQNTTWHQGDPSNDQAFGYYNGTRLPGQYPSADSGRKLLQSALPYTAAVQAALLANNTPQTNVTVKGGHDLTAGACYLALTYHRSDV